MSAWLINLAESSKYFGHNGYRNEPGSHYAFDSFVPHSNSVTVGDLVIERRGDLIAGISIIHELNSERGRKTRNHCPECGNTRLRQRKEKKPIWSCENGHEFEEPVVNETPCLTSRIRYETDFIELNLPFNWKTIEAALILPNAMFSINEINLKALSRVKEYPFVDLISFIDKYKEKYKNSDRYFNPDPKRVRGILDNSLAANKVISSRLASNGSELIFLSAKLIEEIESFLATEGRRNHNHPPELIPSVDQGTISDLLYALREFKTALEVANVVPYSNVKQVSSVGNKLTKALKAMADHPVVQRPILGGAAVAVSALAASAGVPVDPNITLGLLIAGPEAAKAGGKVVGKVSGG